MNKGVKLPMIILDLCTLNNNFSSIKELRHHQEGTQESLNIEGKQVKNTFY